MRSRWLDIGLVLFLRFYGPRRVEAHENAEKEQGQYPAILTEQAWSIKDLLYGQKITPKNFAFAGTKRSIPSRQDTPILPGQVANQNTGFTSSQLQLAAQRDGERDSATT